jgi:signal peptidase II
VLSLVVAGAVVAADQWTKNLALEHLKPGVPRHVLGPVNLLLTFNSGAAFSLGAGATPLVEVAVVVLVGALVLLSRRFAARSALTRVALGLLLGGALGNLIDRLFRHHSGAVVDFIQAVSWWPVFNVADSAVVVGAALLALAWMRRPDPAR